MLRIYFIIILVHIASATIGRTDFSLLDSEQSVKVKFSGEWISGGAVIKNGVAKYFDTGPKIHQRTGSVDVTETLCDPGTNSVTVRIERHHKLNVETYDVPDKYLVGAGAYTCQYNTESGLTIKSDRFTPHCYYGGTLRYGQERETIAISGDNIQVGVDICSGSLGDTLELRSKYDGKLGSCSLDTLDSQQQPKFHFEESKDLIVFNETREQCVDKVVTFDMDKQSQIMNCGKWYNVFS